MLAEPRSRVKYSVNPRGLDWSNDDSKFGQKLLEKMGWKKGSALGLRENGNPEPIKVLTKSDRRGVGCTVKSADNWIAHQDEFSSILAGLNEGSNSQPADEDSSKSFSLEKKSKNSRSRVHYQKFAKGKDLSRYETADLQSIFGQRQKQETAANSYSPAESQIADEEGSKLSFGVITVTSSTSIESYFAQKMAEVKQRLANVSGTAMPKADDNIVRSGVEESEIVLPDNKTKRKKKKRRKDVEDETNNVLDDESPPKEGKKKRKTEHENGFNKINDADEDASEGRKKKHIKCKKYKMEVEAANYSVADIGSTDKVLNVVTTCDLLSDVQVDCVSDRQSRARKRFKKERFRDNESQQQCQADINNGDVEATSQTDRESKLLVLQEELGLTDCQNIKKKKKKKKSRNVDRCQD